MAHPRDLVLRRFTAADATDTYHVFDQAITHTASAFYTEAQLSAWNPGLVTLEQWARRREAAWTIVAEIHGQVVGFADLTTEGVLDMLFVHPGHAGRGIASALVSSILAEAGRRGLTQVETRASRVARPVLEHLGFVVVRENSDNRIRGEVVPNFTMRFDLSVPW